MKYSLDNVKLKTEARDAFETYVDNLKALGDLADNDLDINSPNNLEGADEFIVSGPQGATLKKEENGFRLIKGEAHLLRKRMKKSKRINK